MTIAYREFEAIGARVFLPEGPFGAAGQTPLPNFSPGEVIAGDAEAEYVFLYFAPTASVTLNQGDALWWDQSYIALQTTTGAGSAAFGVSVGTFFLGGRIGDPAALQGNVWSYTFTPGIYGIWVQRSGTSLVNMATVNAQTKPVNTTAVAGQLNQPSAALAGSMGIQAIYSTLQSQTFTGTETTGSAILTAVSSTRMLTRGQYLSGTGIPAGTYITDIQGSTVTMSAAATGSGAQTITAAQSIFWGSNTNLSPNITGVASLPGVYPNATVTGTGVPGSTTILSVTGASPNFAVTLSANCTSTNANIQFTASIYIEGFLRWPFVSSQN